jgi:hypothetical protein
MRTRRGSFLLVCLAVMSLTVILGFSLLRNIQAQSTASTANQRVLLAQSAARAGLEHATEQILRDYASPTVDVVSDAGNLPGGRVELPARSFLHGPFRAPFLALDAPDQSDFDYNRPDADKDVRAEHHLARPWIGLWQVDYHYASEGTSHITGRAREYEPGFYNVTAGPDGAIAPVSFMLTDPGRGATAPQRSDGLFYDAQFRRLDDTDPVAARQAARYRLRYAVDVEDLSGLLLVNPLADMRLPDDYRTPPNWVARAGDAFATMMVTNYGGDLAANDINVAAHCEHVFLGRGWASNVDLDAKGFPITFPLMYRSSNPGDPDCQWLTYQTINRSGQLTDNLYRSPFVTGRKDGGESLYVQDGGTDRQYLHALMGPQMSWWNYHYAVAANAADKSQSWWSDHGVVNPCTTLFPVTPFGRALTQPAGYPASYHASKRKWYEGRVNTPFYVNLMTAPPWVIDAMLVAYLPPKYKIYKYTYIQFVKYTGKDLDGRDTWDESQPGSLIPIDGANPNNNSSQYGRDLLVDTTSPAFAEFPAPFRDDFTNPPSPVPGEVIKPDYYVQDPRLGYPRLGPGHQVMLDAHGQPIIDTFPQRIYPGAAWNGDPDQPGQGSDDSGASINSDDLGYGLCTHTCQPFVHLDPAAPKENPSDYQDPKYQDPDPNIRRAAWEQSRATVEAPAWWVHDPMNYAYKKPDLKRLKFQDSYWWDIYCAMGVAISVMRAQWQQFDNGYYQSASLFPPGMRDPAAYQSIRDLDRQFLAELGESLEMPGTADPATLSAPGSAGAIHAFSINAAGPISSQQPLFQPWIPKNNIRSAMLADLLKCGSPPASGLTSKERARVMELVLNDWRMSFFGSSPGYSDCYDSHGVEQKDLEFRPLDFDGDGIVCCSCYQKPDEIDSGEVDENGVRLPPHALVEEDHRGPRPDDLMWFSPTGCFFVGKSHFYRIITRGELWDNRLRSIVNEASLESVLCVDPEGVDIRDTHTIFQRWDFDKYQGMLSHIRP